MFPDNVMEYGEPQFFPGRFQKLDFMAWIKVSSL